MNRRGFLGSILAACAAPAIVRADSLMRIVPRETLVMPFIDLPEKLYVFEHSVDIAMDVPMTATEVQKRMIEMSKNAAYRMCNPWFAMPLYSALLRHK